MAGEKPTYRICVIRDEMETGRRERFNQVGAAWENDKGQLRAVLNPGVVLRWDDGLNIWLFKNDPSEGKKPEKQPPKKKEGSKS